MAGFTWEKTLDEAVARAKAEKKAKTTPTMVIALGVSLTSCAIFASAASMP